MQSYNSRKWFSGLLAQYVEDMRQEKVQKISLSNLSPLLSPFCMRWAHERRKKRWGKTERKTWVSFKCKSTAGGFFARSHHAKETRIRLQPCLQEYVRYLYGGYRGIRYKNIFWLFPIYLFVPRFHHRPKWILPSTQYCTTFQEP